MPCIERRKGSNRGRKLSLQKNNRILTWKVIWGVPGDIWSLIVNSIDSLIVLFTLAKSQYVRQYAKHCAILGNEISGQTESKKMPQNSDISYLLRIAPVESVSVLVSSFTSRIVVWMVRKQGALWQSIMNDTTLFLCYSSSTLLSFLRMIIVRVLILLGTD